jgi:hypothetical protein
MTSLRSRYSRPCRGLTWTLALAVVSVAPCGAPAPSLATAIDSTSVLVRCEDFRTLEPIEIPAARFSLAGVHIPAWSPDTSQLCLGVREGVSPNAISDGQGGALLAWVDNRSGDGDIYAQRLTAQGEIASGWVEGGRPVCVAPHSQYQLAIAADGSHGLLLAWVDFRDNQNSRVHAFRLTGSGTSAEGWIQDGNALPGAGGAQSSPQIASDGGGGAVVAWLELVGSTPRVQVAHLTPGGVLDPTFSVTNFANSDAAGAQSELHLIADGVGGVVLAWRGEPDSSCAKLRAMRLTSSGTPASGWPAEGVSLTTGTGPGLHLQALVPDSAGGAIAVWRDEAALGAPLYAQRVTAAGTIGTGWPVSGAAVSDGTGIPDEPAARRDGSGGVIIAWHQPGASSGADIVAQRLDGNGAVAPGWPAGGLLISEAEGDQTCPAIAVDSGGVIFTWLDERSDAAGGFLAARTTFHGDAPKLLTRTLSPGRVQLVWDAGGYAASVLRVERAIGGAEWATLAEASPRDGKVALDDRGVAPGAAVRYRLVASSEETEIYFPEVALVVPAIKPLALTRVRLSDSHGAVSVEFTLPSGNGASLTIVDVAGRRLAKREVGELGAGDHRLEISVPSGVAPGIYFVRLSQGNVVRTRQVALYR